MDQALRVLIVEDERILALELRMRLEHMGYEVVGTATNAQDALTLSLAQVPEVILMDIQIEGPLDGIQTAVLINERTDIPIIFLSAYSDETTLERARASGPYAYLLKPFQDRELDISIRTVVQKHRLERKVKQSETKFRTLFEKSAEAIVILDNQGQMVEVNTAARNLYPGTCPGKGHIFDYFPSETRPNLEKRWRNFLVMGYSRGVYKCLLPEAKTRFLEYDLQANYLPGLHIGFLRDSTQRFESERSIQNLARFAAEAPNPIFRLDSAGKVLFANNVARQLLPEWNPRQPLTLPASVLRRLRLLNRENPHAQFTVRINKRIYSFFFVFVGRGPYINLYGTDVTRLKTSERLGNFQNDILEMIAKGLPLSFVMEEMGKRIPFFLPDSLLAVIQVDLITQSAQSAFRSGQSGDWLRNLALTPADTQRLITLVKAGETLVVENCTTSPEQQPLALALTGTAIQSYWISPLQVDAGRTAVCLCIFHTVPRKPGKLESKLVNMVSKVISVAYEREQYYKSLFKQALVFENINDAVILTNQEGAILEYNPGAEKMFGFRKEEVLGRDIRVVLPLDRKGRLDKLIRFASENLNFPLPRFTDEIGFQHKNGWQGLAEISVIRLSGATPDTRGTLCVFRDVTAKKKAEAALATSEANLRSLVENTDDIILSLDRQGRLVTFNLAFVRLFQQFLEENRTPHSGMSLFELVPEAHRAQTREIVSQALGGDQLRQELRLSRHGRILDLEVSLNPIFTDEVVLNGVSVIARDITLRKQAEDELKRTNFELDSFVYRASHDLRAPLKSILGLVTIMGFEKDESQKAYYLQLIEKSVGKLDNFISDLTNFSRNTRLEVAQEPVDWATLVSEAIENLRYMENASHLRIESEQQQSQPFYSDPQRISIVLQNLLSNAIKYSNIQQADPFVEIRWQADEREALLTVRDNGKGIAPEYLGQIFDMFFRASEDSYGSGLGLYITRQVVEKLGGRIEVNSTLGQGTTFTVRVPNRGPAAD